MGYCTPYPCVVPIPLDPRSGVFGVGVGVDLLVPKGLPLPIPTHTPQYLYPQPMVGYPYTCQSLPLSNAA